MILYDDNYASIWKQLNNDKEKVNYYVNKNYEKVFKDYRKSPRLPIWRHETITIPNSNNRYLLYYYIMTPKEVADHTCFYGAVLLLNDKYGRLMVAVRRNMGIYDEGEASERGVLQIYTNHFFSRYRERMKLDTSLNTYDVIASFFGRSGGYFGELSYDNLVLEKNRDKGNSAYVVDDGVILSNTFNLDIGEYKPILVMKHNTFLSRNILKKNQEKYTPMQDEMRELVLLTPR